MLDILRILAIDSTVDETVSFDALKIAYKAACLRTHPDKTGIMSNVDFVAVGNAYTELLKLIQQELSLKTTSSKSGLSFFGEADEINKRFAVLKSEMDLARGEMNQLDDDIKKFSENVRRQNDEIDDLMVRFSRLPRYPSCRKCYDK